MLSLIWNFSTPFRARKPFYAPGITARELFSDALGSKVKMRSGRYLTKDQKPPNQAGFEPTTSCAVRFCDTPLTYGTG